MPFLAIPVFYCKRVVDGNFGAGPTEPSRNPQSGISRAIYAAMVGAALVLYGVRCFAALGSKWAPALHYLEVEPYFLDSTNYLRVHGLVQFFYTVPLYFVAIYMLLAGTTSIPLALYHLSVINFGHMSQSEFAWVKGAFHEKNPNYLQEGGQLFWAMHLGSVIVAWMVMNLLEGSVHTDVSKSQTRSSCEKGHTRLYCSSIK